MHFWAKFRGCTRTGFLSFLQKQMAEHPEMIEPADRAQLSRIRKLVKGVDVE
jgi:hypothetical protein